MTNDEMIRMRQANFRQTNAYAMQNGMFCGLWTIGCLACFVGGLTQPMLADLWLLMLVGFPVFVWILTLRFRKIVGLDVNFPFARGFMHALLTQLYASIWAGVATFVYMQYVDGGFLFDCWLKTASDPALQQQMELSGMNDQIRELTGGGNFASLIDDLRHLGSATYTAMIIYFHIFASPIIATLVGLCSIHRVHYKAQ